MPHTFNYGCVEEQANPSGVLQDTYSLRYQVYINEWEFEAPDGRPVDLEYDDYDEHSSHFYARCKTEKKIIGTVRTILNSDLGFPIERHFELTEKPEVVDRGTVGEISSLPPRCMRKVLSETPCTVTRSIFLTASTILCAVSVEEQSME